VAKKATKAHKRHTESRKRSQIAEALLATKRDDEKPDSANQQRVRELFEELGRSVPSVASSLEIFEEPASGNLGKIIASRERYETLKEHRNRSYTPGDEELMRRFVAAKEAESKPLETFGERLRRLRVTQGLSQEELAATALCEKDAISKYENGRRSPRPTTIKSLAEALGVDITVLTVGEAPS
jgi:ribosome-binding protein aMBF1 (putative translation factor)